MTNAKRLRAQEIAEQANKELDGNWLIVNPAGGNAQVFSTEDFAKLDGLNGWYMTRPLFEHVHNRRPSRGELINLGRQLGKRYPKDHVGPHAIYFIAPEGTPVRPR